MEHLMSAEPATLMVAASIPTALPGVEQGYRDVLDLGCGTSRALDALALPARALRVGVDANRDAVRAAAQQRVATRPRSGSPVHFVVADGQALPFRAESFGFVISKAAMPYMDVPAALREVNRVLRDGGQVWMTLHPVRMAVMRILSGLRTARIKDILYQTYAILNGLALHYWGRQFRFPLNRRRIESVQTLTGIAKALSAAGFVNVRYQTSSRGAGYEDKDRIYGRLVAVAAWKARAHHKEVAATTA